MGSTETFILWSNKLDSSSCLESVFHCLYYENDEAWAFLLCYLGSVNAFLYEEWDPCIAFHFWKER